MFELQIILETRLCSARSLHTLFTLFAVIHWRLERLFSIFVAFCLIQLHIIHHGRTQDSCQCRDHAARVTRQFTRQRVGEGRLPCP